MNQNDKLVVDFGPILESEIEWIEDSLADLHRNYYAQRKVYSSRLKVLQQQLDEINGDDDGKSM